MILEFRLLGPLHVVAGSAILDLAGQRQRRILALLLLHPRQVVTVADMVAAAWDEDPPATARRQVHTALWRLRRVLAQHGGASLLLSEPGGYRLDVEPLRVDLYRFESLVTEGRRLGAAGQVADAVAKLRAAVALWRGPALAGLHSTVLELEGARLEELRLTAIEDKIDYELVVNDNPDLVAELSLLAVEHPLRERLAGALMLALYRNSRQAEALQVFRRTRRRLVDELGIEPGAELRELERAILADDLRLAPPPAAAPPIAPVPVPRQLPPAIPDLAGRDELVGRLVGLLTPAREAQTMRIIVVTGPGGVGKTALAVHLAHQLSDRFPDGQLFAHLRGAEPSPTGAGRLLGRFLRELGMPGAAVPATLEDRQSAFRSMVAGRRMLVLLDDAAAEEQVRALLPGTAGHLVVVTTRRRLTGLAGARHVEVGVLDEAASVELLSATADPEVVAASADATRALIECCGGLPLALRIAAARLAARPHWKVGDLLERLEDEHRRLDEFVHGDLSVRSSIAITYEALPDPARRLFRLLSLPTWSTLPRWAAAPLLDLDSATAGELLEVLVEARAVEVVPGSERTYRLHDLVRVYARERLAAEEPPQLQLEALRRLLGCQLYLTERAHRLDYGGDYTVLHGPAPRWTPDPRTVADLLVQPLAWMEQERGRIVDSVGQAAKAGLHEYAWDLVMSSVFLFERGVHYDDWRETAEVALLAAQRHGDTRGEAAMLYTLGALAVHQVQPEQALRHLTAAERLFAQMRFPHGRGLALRHLGFIDRVQGRHDSAAAKLRESLQLLRSVGDRSGEAHVLSMLARVHLEHGEPEPAHGLLDEALAISRATGNRRGTAQMMHAIGDLQLVRNEYEDAQRQFAAVLTVVQQTGDSTGEAYARLGLGLAVLGQVRLAGDEMEELLRQGRFAEADGADVARRRRLREAAEQLRGGIEHARRTGDRMIEARLLLATAEAHAAARRPTAATADLAQALGIFGELGAKRWQAQAYQQLGNMHLAAGDDAAAAAAHAAAATVLASLSASING